MQTDLVASRNEIFAEMYIIKQSNLELRINLKIEL